MKKKKSKSRKSTKLTKVKVIQAAKDSGMQLLVGGVGGTVLGAVLGSIAPFAGLGTILVGSLLNEKYKIVSSAGVGMLTYGVAKAVEHRTAAKASTVNGISLGSLKEGMTVRLSQLKDGWVHALYADKLMKRKGDPITSDAIEGLAGRTDFSRISALDEKIKHSALAHQQSQEEAELDADEMHSSPALSFEDETGEDIPIYQTVEGFSEDLMREEIDISLI